MPTNLEYSALATGLGKLSSHSNHKRNAKECSNYLTIALISHAIKVMLKILQARLQQYVNRELPDVQAVFRKGRGTRDQIANICWQKFRKTSISASLMTLKTVCGSQQTGKFLKRWEYQNTWPASWQTYIQVRKQQFELDMQQWLVPNRKSSTSRLYIITLLIQLLCRIHHEKGWAGGSTSWKQDCWEKYQ